METLACSEGATGAANRSVSDVKMEMTVRHTWKSYQNTFGFTCAICCVFRLSSHFNGQTTSSEGTHHVELREI